MMGHWISKKCKKCKRRGLSNDAIVCRRCKFNPHLENNFKEMK